MISRLIAIFIFSLAMSCNAQSNDENDLIAVEPLGQHVLRGQPIQLFDGKTMDGWAKRDGSPPKNWVVEDGTIFRKSGGGDLYHEQWFQDFDFEFEWKLKAGGNSGVKYRVQAFGKQMLGCEYQLQDDKGRDFHRHSTGALYAVYEPSKNKQPPVIDQWNKSRIIVCGQFIEHWLNDERILQVTAGDLDWWKRVEKSKFRKKDGFGLNREGRIFLQDHGNPVWFRNLVLTPLDSDQPALIEEQR